MQKLEIGDIVVVWGTGIRRLVVDSRDEITSDGRGLEQYRMKTVYKVAGNEYSNVWFNESEIGVVNPRL